MHYFVEFCRDRRLRTFESRSKKLQHTCSKRGGGVKGCLNNVKKTALLVDVGFPYHKHQQHQYLTFTIICEGDISCTGRSTDRTVNFWAMLPTNVISFWRANWKKRYAFTVSISVTVLNFVISFVTYFYKTRKY